MIKMTNRNRLRDCHWNGSGLHLSLLLCLVVGLPWVACSQEWVDPSTPDNVRTLRGMHGRSLSLVFSDEFLEEGRTFADGHDTRWTSEDRPGIANAALQYYNSSHVLTKDGELVIQTTRANANWTEYDPNNGQAYEFSRLYQSGMLTTWNKFCFTSGVIEISFQLPGPALKGGLWPAFWVRSYLSVVLNSPFAV